MEEVLSNERGEVPARLTTPDLSELFMSGTLQQLTG
jgi:hypothetical protein